MKSHWYISAAIVMAFISGCAAKQECPKVPVAACEQCMMQIRTETTDTAKTIAMFAADGADVVLAFLKKAESYLQENIKEWKVNHPELVEAGEKKLEELRAKIHEYESRVRSSL